MYHVNKLWSQAITVPLTVLNQSNPSIIRSTAIASFTSVVMETRRNLNEKCILSLKTMRAHELASRHIMAQLSFIPAIAILIRYAFLAMHISYHSPSLCLL